MKKYGKREKRRRGKWEKVAKVLPKFLPQDADSDCEDEDEDEQGRKKGHPA